MTTRERVALKRKARYWENVKAVAIITFIVVACTSNIPDIIAGLIFGK